MKLKRKKINLKENVTLNTAKMVIINEYPLITKEHQEKKDGLHIKILIKSIIDQQVQQVEILKQIKNILLRVRIIL